MSHSYTNFFRVERSAFHEKLFRSNQPSTVGPNWLLGTDRAGDMAGRMVALTDTLSVTVHLFQY